MESAPTGVCYHEGNAVIWLAAMLPPFCRAGVHAHRTTANSKNMFRRSFLNNLRWGGVKTPPYHARQTLCRRETIGSFDSLARPGIFRGVYLYTLPANPFTNYPNILDNMLPCCPNLQIYKNRAAKLTKRRCGCRVDIQFHRANAVTRSIGPSASPLPESRRLCEAAARRGRVLTCQQPP